MQNVIDTDFAGHTVIAVIHRLGYIRHFDKVAFLQEGELLGPIVQMPFSLELRFRRSL